MRGYNFISKANEAVGRITKQNQTHDVGPNEIKTQAKKFGNSVDKDGRPTHIAKKIQSPILCLIWEWLKESEPLTQEISSNYGEEKKGRWCPCG